MRYVRLRVSNYKSFFESPELTFAPGLNVIVGQNNSGKTALLEAMALTYGDRPHRSLATLPTRTTPQPPRSTVQFTFEVDASELRSIIVDRLDTTQVSVHGNQDYRLEADSLLRVLNGTFSITCAFTPSQGFPDAALDAYPVASSSGFCLEFRVDATNHVIILAQQNYVGAAGPQNRLPSQLGNILRERIYAFRAERMNVGEAPIGTDPALAPNAANLAQVLHLLHASNPARFRRFQSYVRNIFPQIRQITVPPVGSTARILLWTVEPDTERDDLAVSLAESGTGIAKSWLFSMWF